MLCTGSNFSLKNGRFGQRPGRLGTHPESRTSFNYDHLDECTFRSPHDTSSFVLAVTHPYGWGNISFLSGLGVCFC